MKRLLAIALASTLALTGCSMHSGQLGNSGSDNTSTSDSSSDVGTDTGSDSGSTFTDSFGSGNVSTVRDGYVGACSSSTMGEMADAFMDSPEWSEFTSDSGETIVELRGGVTNGGVPADALFQFKVTGDTFSTSYLSIDGESQGMLVISGLLTKMCNAV